MSRLVFYHQASAQEQETVGVSDVAEHVSSNTTNSDFTSEALSASPIEALAEGAARLIALANSGGLSVGSNSANPMCPVLRGCSKRGCGVSNILTGENAITDEQYEQFYQLNIKKKDDMGPIKLELKKNKRHMKEMMSKDELDVKAIKKMQDKMASLARDMVAMKLDYKLQMAQVLTGAQRTALRKAMIKKRQF